MESVRRRANIVLINKASQQKFQVSKPGFKRFTIFDENLVGVELVKPVIELDKAIYVGAAVLDLSKLTMMNFWYRILKPKFPDARLCFTGQFTQYLTYMSRGGGEDDLLIFLHVVVFSTLLYITIKFLSDTDSLLVDIPTDDLYRDLADIREHLDLSNYPQDHPLYDPSNKAVLNKFKDECEGNIMKEFVGLRSKCYSILIQEPDGDKQKRTAAGVKMSVQKSLHHDIYKQTLEKENDFLYYSESFEIE